MKFTSVRLWSGICCSCKPVIWSQLTASWLNKWTCLSTNLRFSPTKITLKSSVWQRKVSQKIQTRSYYKVVTYSRVKARRLCAALGVALCSSKSWLPPHWILEMWQHPYSWDWKTLQPKLRSMPRFRRRSLLSVSSRFGLSNFWFREPQFFQPNHWHSSWTNYR